MPVLTQLEDYWNQCQKFQAYAPGDRELYVNVVLQPSLRVEHDPLKRRLLERLINRLPRAQTG